MKRLLVWVLMFPLFAATVPGSRAADGKIQAYQDAVQADPKNADAHYNLGYEYFNRKQYDLAAEEFGKAEKLNPKDLQSKELRLFSKAYASYLKGDYDASLVGFKETLKVNPKNPNASKLLGAAYLQLKQYDQAEKAYQNFLAEFPGDKDGQVGGNLNLAKAYLLEKKFDLAVPALQKVLAIQPRQFEALNNLGGAYFQLGKYTEAADAWKKASASFRTDSDAKEKAGVYKYLGYSYYRLGRLQDAVDSYQTSLKSAPDDPDVLYNLGVAELDRARYDSAAEAFQKAFAKNSGDSNAALGKAQAIDAAINEHMEKGSSSMVNGEYRQAIKEYQKVLTYQGDNEQAKKFIADAQRAIGVEVGKLYDAGAAASKAGNALEAVRQWDAALAMDPENTKVKEALRQQNLKTGVKASSLASAGEEALAAGDYAAAIEKYRQALAVKPDSADLKAKMAKARAAQKADYDRFFAAGDKAEQAGKLREAIQSFGKAVAVDPSSAEAHQRLDQARVRRSVRIDDLLKEGQALVGAGDSKSARAKFEGVLALDPNNDKANDQIRQITGQKSQAKVDAEQAKKIYYEGVNLYINGKIEDAIVKWQECLRLDPGNANVTNNINRAKAKLQTIQKLKQG